jgi:nitrogen fixation NifU-like protein
MAGYSETLMDHFSAPRNTGRLDGADRTGRAGAIGSGAFFILYLRVDQGTIREAKFQTHGCGLTIAAGSMLTELIMNHSLAECRGLTVERLIAALDGVPPHKRHGPALAIAALHDALR